MTRKKEQLVAGNTATGAEAYSMSSKSGRAFQLRSESDCDQSRRHAKNEERRRAFVIINAMMRSFPTSDTCLHTQLGRYCTKYVRAKSMYACNAGTDGGVLVLNSKATKGGNMDSTYNREEKREIKVSKGLVFPVFPIFLHMTLSDQAHHRHVGRKKDVNESEPTQGAWPLMSQLNRAG